MKPGKKIPAVPSFFYNLPKKEIAAFIQAYFDGDGCVAMTKINNEDNINKKCNDYPTPKLFSATREFLQEMQGLMLMKLEVATKLNPHNTPKGMMYELTIRGHEGREKFRQLIKPISREKQARLEKITSTARVKSWANIPSPELLVSALREKVPYQEYRNNDYYVYGKGKFTVHALDKLYTIAQRYNEKHNCINGAMKKDIENEYSILTRKDIAWECIENISYEGVQELYDFTVEHDSFMAAPYLLLHNSKFYGQSEENLRNTFEDAEKNAPSIVFIDEIDAIAPKREESRGEVERRVVAQLLALMDGLKSRGKVVVIAATNIPNVIDPALRRPGRFDREVEVGVPSKDGRLTILKIHSRNMPLAKNVDLNEIAQITYGFVGADLSALVKEAAMIVLRKVLPELKLKEDEPISKEILEKLSVSQKHFKEALKIVRPSALREVFVEIPNVRWTDVGGLEDIKQELKETVEWPLKNPDAFKRMGVRPPRGVLLYGAPGTGKTMLAKAISRESDANFISIKGPELLSKWVGESEKAVREIFKKARLTSPTIIFFDEIDSLAPKRVEGSSNHATESVVNQILTEMDGLIDLSDVIIIAASNRPDIIDSALLRPGRFDRIIHCPAPDKETRYQVFQIHTKKMPLNAEIPKEDEGFSHKVLSKMASDEAVSDKDIKEIEKKKKRREDLSGPEIFLWYLAERTEGYTGADIESICREAAIQALREDMKSKEVTEKHFEAALKIVRPSITKDVEEKYKMLKDKFSSARGQEIIDREEMKKKKELNYFG
ncbi:AAA family ATPase [Candidatus Woesearchaeota archaeon]|nr:AAA family ATPase [Candidatus Woesearchaeota archaeon]